MKILPINNSNNQISHKAVNKKFLDKAINTYLQYKPYHNQGHLIRTISNTEILGLIKTQDAIDTLEAIKPLAQNSIKVIDSIIKEMKKTLPNQ